MQSFDGKTISIILDNELLELEKRYRKLKNSRPRSELIRELYFFHLNEALEEDEQKTEEENL